MVKHPALGTIPKYGWADVKSGEEISF